MTFHVGIGPEISQSVKDIYTAANVKQSCSAIWKDVPNHYSGSNRVGGGQCRACIEKRQDRHPRFRHQFGQKEHSRFEG